MQKVEYEKRMKKILTNLEKTLEVGFEEGLKSEIWKSNENVNVNAKLIWRSGKSWIWETNEKNIN